MCERKRVHKQPSEYRKGKLTIAERLETGRRDSPRRSKKFETNPRLKKIYVEESAKTELWLQLVKARQQAGLTQEELAGRIGVSQWQGCHKPNCLAVFVLKIWSRVTPINSADHHPIAFKQSGR